MSDDASIVFAAGPDRPRRDARIKGIDVTEHFDEPAGHGFPPSAEDEQLAVDRTHPLRVCPAQTYWACIGHQDEKDRGIDPRQNRTSRGANPITEEAGAG